MYPVIDEEFGPVRLPCGAWAEFDDGAGYGYRCTICNAVYGSVGMPRSCREAMEQEEVVSKLKGNK